MNILAIETSTDFGSLAYYKGDELLWSQQIQSGRNHNTEVLEALEVRIGEAECQPELIFVGAGPGNYTGVRVAISIAQGFQMVFGAKVVLVPSFLSVCPEVPSPVIFGNARRGEFYVTQVSEALSLAPIEILDKESALSWLASHRDQNLVVYEQSEVLDAVLKEADVHAVMHQCSAEGLAEAWLVMPLDQRERYEQAAQEPIYLRPPNMQKSGKVHPLLSL